MKRRVLTVALALLLAVIGTGAVLAYVNQADARALAGQKAVTVVVAQQLVPSGTAAGAARQEGLLGTETLPAASVPANAVRSITSGLAALVTSAEVQPGQLLLRPMLVPAALAAGGLAVPNGMVAVTISLCVPEAVAGNVHAGSTVAVFDTLSSGGSGNGGGLNAQPGCSGSHTQQAGSGERTVLVLPGAEVLSVGPASAPSSQAGASGSGQGGAGASQSATSSQGSVLVTLAVRENDAKRLILLTETGLPYLALLK